MDCQLGPGPHCSQSRYDLYKAQVQPFESWKAGSSTHSWAQIRDTEKYTKKIKSWQPEQNER